MRQRIVESEAERESPLSCAARRVDARCSLRMQLSRDSAMEAFDSAVRKKHILAEHQREDIGYVGLSRALLDF